MAELPVTAAARNLTAATASPPAMSARTTSTDEGAAMKASELPGPLPASVCRVFRVRPLAEVTPALLGDLEAVIAGRLLDVGEGLVSLLVGNPLDLVEAGQRVLDVGGVRQRLLPLFGESKDTVGQV